MIWISLISVANDAATQKETLKRHTNPHTHLFIYSVLFIQPTTDKKSTSTKGRRVMNPERHAERM